MPLGLDALAVVVLAVLHLGLLAALGLDLLVLALVDHAGDKHQRERSLVHVTA